MVKGQIGKESGESGVTKVREKLKTQIKTDTKGQEDIRLTYRLRKYTLDIDKMGE